MAKDSQTNPDADRNGDSLDEQIARIRAGGSERAHAKAVEQGKLFARARVDLLLDAGSFVEDALFANVAAGDLPADGIVTGSGRIDGRPVCVMANDSTVKAGSWGKRTVEKILRDPGTAPSGCACRFSTWSTRPAPASRTRFRCFPGRRGAGKHLPQSGAASPE